MLSSLDKLERLNLQGCRKLKDDAATVLAGFKHLRMLDLKDSSLETESVKRIREALPSCEILY